MASVLVIDDVTADLQLIAQVLLAEGVDLLMARNGEEGLDRARRLSPDLILLDVVMPSPDGYEVCRRLKADSLVRDIPVVFLSVLDEPDERVKGLEAGAVDFISKPFDAAEVRARVRTHLHTGQRLRQAIQLPEEADRDEDTPSPVTQALRILLAELQDPPTLGELAQRVGVNERKLSQAFRNQLGMNVKELVREQRFQVACRLLTQTEEPIGRVAERVGYGHIADFSNAFRRRFGVPPSAYRTTAGSGDE